MLCSWTSLAVHRLIEMCKSFWHRMNRQLLAGCPVPLCVLPLNWSAPVCPPSFLCLPMLTAARFCLTSKARLCVPSNSLRPISAAVWLKRTFHNRNGWGKTVWYISEIKGRRCKADKVLAIQWLGLPAHPLLWMMVMFHLQVNMQRTASATIHSEYTVHIYSNIFEWPCVWLCICIHALVCVTVFVSKWRSVCFVFRIAIYVHQ